MTDHSARGRWVAVVTGVFSVFIGIVYLLLITFLDSRGPMLPPPPEALGEGAVVVIDSFVEALQPYEGQFQETF